MSAFPSPSPQPSPPSAVAQTVPAQASPAQSSPYSVSIWESIAITAGAVLLVAIGLAGLGIKALNNAFDPRRAQATAQSIAGYQIPGGSKGVFGTNLGGGKLAVMNSLSPISLPAAALPAGTPAPPETELFLARIPIIEGANNPKTEEDIAVDSSIFFSGFSFSYQAVNAFQVNSTQTENRLLCNVSVPITIQKGFLTITSDVPPIPAARYEAEINLKEHRYVAIVSALGNTADAQAIEVFNSLRCR